MSLPSTLLAKADKVLNWVPVNDIPTADDIETLLEMLCVELGICLQGETYDRLVDSPPSSAAAFTDAVFRAQGLDPASNGKLHRQVQFRVSQVFDRGDRA